MVPRRWELGLVALVFPSLAAAVPLYQNVTAELGLTVYPSAFLGPGCAMADVDGDGDLDIYVVDGLGDPNSVFRNDGNHVFQESGAALGIADDGYGKAPVFVDWDNDGDQDFLLTRFGPTQGDRLFRNDGGVFTDVTAGSGFDLVKNYHTGQAWADYDKDGDVDCYVTTYAGTKRNLLMRNNGDGTFTNVAPSLGIENPEGLGFQPAWIDFDLDNDMDLYVANDIFEGENKLFRNNGDATFTDISVPSHADMDLSTMGLAVGDYDSDGYPDLYMTNIYEGNCLLRNLRNSTFADLTGLTGTGCHVTCWGCDWLDYDNDGRLDLYVCAMIPHTNLGEGPLPSFLFHNQNGIVFSDVSTGSGADNVGYAFSSAVGDYDQDGDLDIFKNNWQADENAPPSAMLENLYAPRGSSVQNFIRVNLRGTVSNRDGIGARVELFTDFGRQSRWRQCGTSYVASSEPTLHFGMRNSTVATEIKVTWPSGLVESVFNVPRGSTITLVEGQIASGVESSDRGGSLHLISASPNPAPGAATLQWQRASQPNLSLVITDVTGRQIRTLRVTDPQRTQWDGRDALGRPQGGGVYFVRLVGGSSTLAEGRVTLVR